MLATEEYFTIDHIGRYAEDSRVEGFPLDVVVQCTTLAGRIIVEACRARSGLLEGPLDSPGIFDVQLALPKTFVHAAGVGAEDRAALRPGPQHPDSRE